MSIELGAAYVTVIPEMKGAQKAIGQALGDKSMGDGIGKNMGDSILGGIKGAVAKAAKVVAGMAVVKKGFDFGKAAFDGFAEFEQLSGGISKLYGTAGQSLEQYASSMGQTVDQARDKYASLTRAQDDMLAKAQRGWLTAGMDANSYMETATSFSASLINSLGGDTEKAAQMTDRAMTAISDNYNTFGGDMSNVTNAFMGFAKQNYTMLDNLDYMGALAA